MINDSHKVAVILDEITTLEDRIEDIDAIICLAKFYSSDDDFSVGGGAEEDITQLVFDMITNKLSYNCLVDFTAKLSDYILSNRPDFIN